MLDKPRIVQTQVQPTAVIRLTIPRSEIQSLMGSALAEVMDTIAAQGIAPAGPWFSHHFRMDADVFDFEVGVPVARPVAERGRVKSSELPAATVARTIYRGPYEGLGAAWGEFMTWLAFEKHEPAANLWECYVAGPESDPDPAKWRTELNRPLTRKRPARKAQSIAQPQARR
jgi:effector-binding domain-containing protein